MVGLVKSVASYSLHITALSAETGLELAAAHIPSSIYNGLTDFLVISDSTAEEPYVIWLEHAQKSNNKWKDIRFAKLSPEMRGQPKALKGAQFRSLRNIGLNERGMFVGIRSDGAGMAMKLDRGSQGLNLVWEFEESVNRTFL